MRSDIRSPGPVLRAAGVPYDIRRAQPYGIYDRFDFDVALRQHGDLYDNYLIRLDEIRQSLRILQQAVKQIPAGPIIAGKPQYQVRVPAGEVYGRIEAPKGELGFYVVSNGQAESLALSRARAVLRQHHGPGKDVRRARRSPTSS